MTDTAIKAQRIDKSFARGKGTATPWGRAQGATSFGRGLTSYSTAGHGGFKVSKGVLATMPAVLQNASGWYEEDSEWAKVAVAFPQAFTEAERQQAEKTLREWHPDAWEALNGRTLSEGESHVRAQQAFDARHSDDFVVISAIFDPEDKNMVVCVAAKGGRRGNPAAEQTFRVPAAEYETRNRFGFVIDLARHQSLGNKGFNV